MRGWTGLRMTPWLRFLVAIERRKLAASEWWYRWRHWSDANLPITEDWRPTTDDSNGRGATWRR